MSNHVRNLSDPEFMAALSHGLAISMDVAVLVVDASLTVEDANPAAVEAIGHGLAPGVALADILAESDVERLRGAVSADTSHPGPFLLRGASRAHDPGRALLGSVLKVGRPARFVIIGRSAATDLRREARILRAQRYEIVGQLTSGVAHDINNRLSTVTTFSDLMLGDAEPGSQDAEDLAEIKRAGLDAAVITRKLDLFAGGHAGGATEASVPDVIRGFEKLIRRFVGSAVDVVMELDDACPPVTAAPIRIEEVLMALVSNARDAMAGGGVLTLRAFPGTPGSGTAVLEIHDTGTEDLASPLERALEPFYSSKSDSEGSGLGLATVHGIVTALGGSIEISRAGADAGGTRARIIIPGAPVTGTDGAADRNEVGGATVDGMRIALIEPDDGIRRALHRGLTRAGARVSAFSGVPLAPGLVEADARAWDAVVADVPDRPDAGRILLDAVRGDAQCPPVVLLRRRASPRCVPPYTPAVLELAKPVDLDAVRAALSYVTGRDAASGPPA